MFAKQCKISCETFLIAKICVNEHFLHITIHAFIFAAGINFQIHFAESRDIVIRPGRIPLFSSVNEFKNVVKFNIAGVVKINNVVRFNLGVTSFWRRTCGPINCFDDKSNLTLLKIYQK